MSREPRLPSHRSPATNLLLQNAAPKRRMKAPPAAVRRFSGRPWERLRKLIFAENPLCVHCERKGLVRAWEELDHITPISQGGTDARENLQGLCIDCHRIKSAEEAVQR
jgi:5-methylcytosine-specific restriction enzyme A